MNEERLEAYRSLIQELLNCNEGEEWELLQAHSELRDVGLQQMMLEVAEDLRTQGDSDNANFLMNIAGQLMGVHGNISDAQADFLSQVLKATADSSGDADVVYPLLAANTDKLDESLAELLRAWAITTLEKAKPTVTGISSQSPGKPVESMIALDCPNASFTPCLGYSGLFMLFHVSIGAIAALVVGGFIWLVSKKHLGKPQMTAPHELRAIILKKTNKCCTINY